MAGDGDKILCGHCSEEVKNDGDSCICRLCSCRYHYGDCSMKRESWRGLGKKGQNTWTCYSCRNKDIQAPAPSSMDIHTKLDKLLEMQKTVEEIKTSMGFLSEKYDQLV